jgi:hypothetical protein
VGERERVVFPREYYFTYHERKNVRVMMLTQKKNFHYPDCTATSLAVKSDTKFGANSAQPTDSSTVCDPYFATA